MELNIKMHKFYLKPWAKEVKQTGLQRNCTQLTKDGNTRSGSSSCFIFPHAETYDVHGGTSSLMLEICVKKTWFYWRKLVGGWVCLGSLASSWVASSRIQPSLLLNYLYLPKSIFCNSVYNVYGISSTSVQSGPYGSKYYEFYDFLTFLDFIGEFQHWVKKRG